MSNETDPQIVTYVFEETSAANNEWHDLFSGAAAAASLGAQWTMKHVLSNHVSSSVEEWVNAGYRKHARRAKTKDFEKVLTVIPGELLETPFGRVYATVPLRQSVLPAELKRLQMSNFKVNSRNLKGYSAPVTVTLNEDLHMSFGKSVVAAAHAAQLLISNVLAFRNDSALDLWENDGFPVSVIRGRVASPDENANAVLVKDYGLTEVPAGSFTASAQFHDNLLREEN